MELKPRVPSYDDMPFVVVKGCVIQKIPKWDADDLWPYKWEVLAPEGHRISGYCTSFLRRLTKKECLETARYSIEPGEPG